MCLNVELFVSEGGDADVLRFLIEVCRLSSRCRVHLGDFERPTLKTDSVEVEGLSTVCRHLVLMNDAVSPQQLLGKIPEEAAQVSEWINLFLSAVPSSGDTKLKRLNDRLADRVYLAGNSLTLADLIVYVVVHPDAMTFPVAQYGTFCNLLRWHDFVQETVDVSLTLKAVKRKLSAFDFVSPQKRSPQDNIPRRSAGKVTDEGGDCSENAGTKKESNTDTPTNAEELDETKPKRSNEKEMQPKETKKKDEPRIDMLDLRIGKIVSVKAHPDADALYIEEIDMGEEKPRQVISGLKKFVSEDDMQGRFVVVCCNLKAVNMRGVRSNGMVMCASDAEHTRVEPLMPPDNVAVGEKISFEGFGQAPLEEIKPKQKILEALFPSLVTDPEGIARYKDIPFTCSKGPIRSTITCGNVR